VDQRDKAHGHIEPVREMDGAALPFLFSGIVEFHKGKNISLAFLPEAFLLSCTALLAYKTWWCRSVQMRVYLK
jgi:hypothetical protein